jgi:hypothetical protein
MVDWEWVDRKRADGWSWEDLARNPRTGFRPDPSGSSPGQQLRALARARSAEVRPGGPVDSGRRWNLARGAWLAFALLAPWAFLAGVLPSPVGVYVPAIPFLAFLAAAAGAVLAFGLLRSPLKWTPVFRQTATIGAVAGLVIAGTLGVVGVVGGCPTLSPFTTGEPGGWSRVPMGAWSSQGVPVAYFYGSVACPYCSASSWAVLGALERLGNVTNVVVDHSSSTDVDPNTPSVVLGNLFVDSLYVSLDARESTNDQQISAPAFASCTERAYVSAYDALGAIPFLALGGTFVHTGSLVDPGALSGLTGAEIEQQLANHQGPAYQAIEPAEVDLLAYLVWLNGDRPASVASDPSVAPVLAQIH